MPGEHLVLCGEAADGVPAGRPGVLRLPNTGDDPVVRLRATDVSAVLRAAVPDPLADLLELAGFGYVADQCVGRGGPGVEDMGAEWRRPLHFRVQVRCPGLWGRADVSAALRDVLGFLSEDRYAFTFVPYANPPTPDRYFEFAAAAAFPVPPERVVLFSGGLDSLGGAVDEVVVHGRPVVLLTHESTPKLRGRQRMLRRMLDGRARGPRPQHVTVRVNKKAVVNREYTQRERSFLYASLGAVVARMCGLREVWFYENGTVSLNLPISRQVVGAKATRTTHPRVLDGFARLFGLVTGEPFAVRNGSLWRTKGQVVEGIVAAGCGGMVEWSTSCTHTWLFSNEKPHCGTCSQCVDRRFAVLAGGAEAFERADSYRVDLLTDPRAAGEPRTMLASYVETAQQVAAMTEAEFFGRFGEAFRAVRHLGGGSAAADARRVYDLYRRHGREVVRVVEQGVARHAAAVLGRTLPESCLLRLVHDPSVPDDGGGLAAPAPRADEPPAYCFRRRGQGWLLRFDGHEDVWLQAAVGHGYLYELLRMPGRRFTVGELLVAVHGAGAAVRTGDAGEALDDEAKLAFAVRLREIDGELDEARAGHDWGWQALLEEEREQLIAQVKAAGFRGTAKRDNSDLNKIRNSVCLAIRRALATIGKYEPAAHEHLQAAISTGFAVAYDPAAPVAWNL